MAGGFRYRNARRGEKGIQEIENPALPDLPKGEEPEPKGVTPFLPFGEVGWGREVKDIY